MNDRSTPQRSPGMASRHYAPTAPMECLGEDEARARVRELLARGAVVGWLALGATTTPDENLYLIAMPTDPPGYAARLYAALHELDDVGVERIIVTAPPHGEAWRAIHDRLRRGSTPKTS